MKKIGFQLIIVIVNSGFSEIIMNAARDAGARGGTITHCRGTSNEALEKKYGVYLTPDKEMILIVVKNAICDDILKAVYEASGKNNPGQCIAFSLPVENVVGMKFDTIEEAELYKNA